jgi:ATF/CREB family transcription factor
MSVRFPHRYRTAALKCRQRKKAWLQELQASVEYLKAENEQLKTALVASRDEISRLSQLVGGAGVVGPVPIGVSTVGVGGPGGQPISMNVSIPGKAGGGAGGGRQTSGYGY